jgi:acylphosphatase
MKKHVHIYYIGTVQGVGFRFTAREVAAETGVAGWIKNLPDGKVEIMAEAEEDKLNDFLKKIDGYFSRYIHDKETAWSEAKGELKGFEVRF